MSLGIPRRLPSLVHQLGFTPMKREKNDREELRRPPFPEIDLTAEGFTVSHIPWVGVNANQSRKQRLKRMKLAALHENCHKALGHTTYSKFIKCLVLQFYCLIIETFDEKKEQIPVPLNHHLPKNKLEK